MECHSVLSSFLVILETKHEIFMHDTKPYMDREYKDWQSIVNCMHVEMVLKII